MYLRYLDSVPQSETLVMCNEQLWRVELFVLRNNDGSYSLIALSGRGRAQAERVKLQGPYQARAQALAARSAVAAQLQDGGFSIDEMSSTLWRLQAQREIKELRALRKENAPDCRFDPRDVY